jgi:hypothetical protein
VAVPPEVPIKRNKIPALIIAIKRTMQIYGSLPDRFLFNPDTVEEYF